MRVEAELATMSPGDRHSWSHVAHTNGTFAEDPLADALSTWRLIRSVFDTISDVEGGAPPEAVAELRLTERRQAAPREPGRRR